eukprot:1702102-Alexandrium_andersonii.AAC.1
MFLKPEPLPPSGFSSVRAPRGRGGPRAHHLTWQAEEGMKVFPNDTLHGTGATEGTALRYHE